MQPNMAHAATMALIARGLPDKGMGVGISSAWPLGRLATTRCRYRCVRLLQALVVPASSTCVFITRIELVSGMAPLA